MSKQERIFKLFDKDGYICADSSNRQTLTDNGIFVDGFYYYKGVIDNFGDLKPSSGCLTTILIDAISGEFECFEEVESIPLKDKREEVVSEQSEFPNTFTKSMLVSGKHIVETCQGDRYLVAGDYIVGLKGYHRLKDYSNSLEESTYGDSEWDIEKVYSGQGDLNSDSIRAGQGFYSYLESENLTLIWQRETPEQAQKRIRKRELEDKVVTLRQELKQVENELQEL